MHHLGQCFPAPPGTSGRWPWQAVLVAFPAVLVRGGAIRGTALRIRTGARVSAAAGTAAFPGRRAHRILPTRRFR